MNTIRAIPDEHPDKFLDMPEGLGGYWWETDNLVCIPFVEARKEGAFSAFLKELNGKGKIIFFPTLISAKLDSILRSKGYVEAGVMDKMMGFVDGLAYFP